MRDGAHPQMDNRVPGRAEAAASGSVYGTRRQTLSICTDRAWDGRDDGSGCRELLDLLPPGPTQVRYLLARPGPNRDCDHRHFRPARMQTASCRAVLLVVLTLSSAAPTIIDRAITSQSIPNDTSSRYSSRTPVRPHLLARPAAPPAEDPTFSS